MKNIKEMINQRRLQDEDGDKGFTLVEILIAIVLVGILSAVVVVGISNLTSSGNTSACTASQDAAKAGTMVYYTTHANTYPTNFTQLTEGTTPALTLPGSYTLTPQVAPLVATVGSWSLTMTPGASASVAPTFACS